MKSFNCPLLLIFIALTLYLIPFSSGLRGRSKYRPQKTSYFDPVSGIFRRAPHLSNVQSPSSSIHTTYFSTPVPEISTSKVYTFFHKPEDVVLHPTSSFDKKYKRPAIPKINYDFSIGRDEEPPNVSKEKNTSSLPDPNEKSSLKNLYDYAIGRDKEIPLVKKKKIYFDVEEVKPSKEIENSVEDEEDFERRNHRPKPIITFRTNRFSTKAPSYFLPTVASNYDIASTSTTTTTTTTTTTESTTSTTTASTPITTTSIPPATSIIPERSTWRTTTTTERHFTFSKKSSIRDHYRNISKQGSKPQVAQLYTVYENEKFPHFPEQPIGSFPSIFTPKIGQPSNDTNNGITEVEDKIKNIENHAMEKEDEGETATESQKTPYDWNTKTRIRSKLNMNKKRRILGFTSSTTTTSTTTMTTTTTEATSSRPSGQLETRHRYYFTVSDQEPETLQQNPDIYPSNAKITTPRSLLPSTTTSSHFYVEDFSHSDAQPKFVPRFNANPESFARPRVPSLLEFHPSYQEHDFAPRDHVYNRLEELERENEFLLRKKPAYVNRGHNQIRRKGQRRHDRPRPNRRARRPNRRSRHPDAKRHRYNQSLQKRRGPQHRFS
ncbi:uncharacterized protein [Lepeophtheirus salmonis]|uniref:uncharacterized protein n=1 Tax=Lepeophtheirus salmonis TaxID=72036 RepID=UPI001AE913DF|nr:probable serine/threonine-protein kinase DDB_G0275165 [Lepeophtheirus salmonis]